MIDVNGIAQSPAAVAQVENQRVEQQEQNTSVEQGNVQSVVTDSVSISNDAVQLAQALQEAQPSAEQNESATQDRPENQQDGSVPSFLDIRV